MAGSIEELLDMLYNMIDEAKNVPLSSEKCVLERDKALDVIEDIKAELPVEIKRAKDLMANKNDYVVSAKREADNLRKQAEDYVKRITSEDALTHQAEEKAKEILAETDEKCRQLKRAANEYCEDTLRRMEDAVSEAYEEVKHARAKFRSALGEGDAPASGGSSRRAMYDAEADEE